MFNFTVLGLAVALGVLSGCAHSSKINRTNAGEEVPGASNSTSSSAPLNVVRTQSGEIFVRGIKLENTQFDYPVTINSKVEYWIDYFTGRGRGHFSRYLERSELFIPYIVPLLKQNNMPEDLVYLAMIESGFNNHARSHAKAVGPWQFISATGKRYGLMVNWWVDERRDTHKSTLAAVEYLKDLYSIFQSWELAAAAYNAGEAKIARAIRRYGTKDFWSLTRHKFLRPETRDYVPKIIAAAIVAKNRTQFGFSASTVKPGQGEAVAGDGHVVKVEKFDESQNQPVPEASGETLAQVLKAEAYDEYEDGPADLTPSIVTVVENNAIVNEGQPLAKPVPTPHVNKKGEVGGEELADFEVQSPADLLKIARAAGVSYNTVKMLNPELLRWCTPPNVSTYRLKLPSTVKEGFLTAYNHEAFPRKVQFMTYKVKQGETLSRIAGRFGIRVDPISDLNGISPRIPLRSGMRVLLPLPNDRSRSLASLEVRDAPERRKYRKRRPARSSNYRVSKKKRELVRARKIARQLPGDDS